VAAGSAAGHCSRAPVEVVLILVGTSQPLYKDVNDVKFRHRATDRVQKNIKIFKVRKCHKVTEPQYISGRWPAGPAAPVSYLLRPAPIAGVLSDDARLSDVCLSHTSGLSREQRGLGRLKLHRGSPRHMWLITFKVKRSKNNLQGGGGILCRPPAQLVYLGLSAARTQVGL